MTSQEALLLQPGDHVRINARKNLSSTGVVSEVLNQGGMVYVVKRRASVALPILCTDIEKVPAERPTKAQYFMDIAKVVATRATCDRKHVGAVIVINSIVVATGYNGAPKGLMHCDEVGHEMEDGHCVRTVHAEQNAIAQAAFTGVKTEGGTIYTTASPCYICFKLIVNAGIETIVFGELYRDKRIHELAKQAGIKLVDFSKK